MPPSESPESVSAPGRGEDGGGRAEKDGPDCESPTIWVFHGTRVESVDLVSGRRETILEIGTAGGAGMITMDSVTLADDPRAYAYSAAEYSFRLFQIDGTR